MSNGAEVLGIYLLKLLLRVYQCRFHNEAGNEMGAGAGAGGIDPYKRHTDRPGVSPADFARAHVPLG